MPPERSYVFILPRIYQVPMPFTDLRLGNQWEYRFRLVGQPRRKKILRTPRFDQYVSAGPLLLVIFASLQGTYHTRAEIYQFIWCLGTASNGCSRLQEGKKLYWLPLLQWSKWGISIVDETLAWVRQTVG